MPVNLRFEGDEAYIRKDPKTGYVILSRKPASWDDFFDLVKGSDIPKDFMAAHQAILPRCNMNIWSIDKSILAIRSVTVNMALAIRAMSELLSGTTLREKL